MSEKRADLYAECPICPLREECHRTGDCLFINLNRDLNHQKSAIHQLVLQGQKLEGIITNGLQESMVKIETRMNALYDRLAWQDKLLYAVIGFLFSVGAAALSLLLGR